VKPSVLNLAIDIGNSAIKLGIFKDEKKLIVKRYDHFQHKTILELIQQYQVKNMIIGSVKGFHFHGLQRLKRHLTNLIELTPGLPLPIKNLYQTPETLGYDRIAAVTGGMALFPKTHILVIDAGTAITIDFLNKEGSYIGGNISPGLSMRFQALHQYTAQLPLLQNKEVSALLGANTKQAIICGVQNGIIFEINQYIKKMAEKYHPLTTILTGGDVNFFDNKLNYPIFAEPDLVLIGLNKILKYNIYAA
jgi:type III pantothenate kinase